MTPVQILQLSVKKRKLGPFLDFSGFFLFFGISGGEGSRQARLDRRFEQEYYAQLVTAQLSAPLPDGRYRLRGLPDEANKRGWAVRGAQARTELSEDGWRELQAWKRAPGRPVQPERLGDMT